MKAWKVCTLHTISRHHKSSPNNIVYTFFLSPLPRTVYHWSQVTRYLLIWRHAKPFKQTTYYLWLTAINNSKELLVRYRPNIPFVVLSENTFGPVWCSSFPTYMAHRLIHIHMWFPSRAGSYILIDAWFISSLYHSLTVLQSLIIVYGYSILQDRRDFGRRVSVRRKEARKIWFNI